MTGKYLKLKVKENNLHQVKMKYLQVAEAAALTLVTSFLNAISFPWYKMNYSSRSFDELSLFNKVLTLFRLITEVDSLKSTCVWNHETVMSLTAWKLKHQI